MLKVLENIAVNRKDFLKVLQSLKKVAPTRTTDDSLTRGILYKDNGVLYAAASNSEQTIKHKICDTAQELSPINFDINTTLDFARKAKTATVKLHSNERNSIVLKSNSVTFTGDEFRGQLWDPDYRDLSRKDVPEINTILIDIEELRETFSDMSHSISTEPTRYYLNGIYAHQETEDEMIFVATDGHTLARRVLKVNSYEKMENGVIIPKEAIKYFLDASKGLEGAVNICTNGTNLSFSIEDFILLTQLVDGRYPDYERVIPKDHNLRITVGKTDLLENVEMFSIKKKANKAIKHTYDVENNLLKLLRKEKDQSSLEAAVYATTNKLDLAEKVAFGLNSEYVTEILKSIHSEVLDMHITMLDHLRDASGVKIIEFDQGPIAFKSTKPRHDKDVDVIMPMRVE